MNVTEYESGKTEIVKHAAPFVPVRPPAPNTRSLPGMRQIKVPKRRK